MNPDDTDYLDETRGVPEFLRDPIGIVRRRWRWMLSALLSGVVLTGLYAARLEPRYLASATVLVTSQQISEAFVRSTLPSDSLERINAIVGEVLSRETLVGLIEKHALYTGLRKSKTLAEIADRMRPDISIEREEGIASRHQSATVFTISYEASRPDVAAAVANDLARTFTAASIRKRTEQAGLTTEFLRRELESADAELRVQSRTITEFKEQHRGELPDDLGANLAKLDRLQRQRQSLALQIAESETRLAMLSGGEAAPPEARLMALRARLDAQLTVQTELHPDVLALKRQIRSLEAQIARNDGSDPAEPVAAPRGTLAELREQLADTGQTILQIDARVARTPARQEALAALKGKESVLRESYLELLRKVEDAELAQALEMAQQGERFSVVDWAEPPAEPTRSRWRYLVAGGVASVMLSLGLGVVLESLDPVLQAPNQFESVFGLPLLGSVSRIS